MPTLTLTVKYRKNQGIIMSPSELDALYFYGVTITSKDGTALSSEVKRAYIMAAQEEIEKFLGIQ